MDYAICIQKPLKFEHYKPRYGGADVKGLKERQKIREIKFGLKEIKFFIFQIAIFSENS